MKAIVTCITILLIGLTSTIHAQHLHVVPHTTTHFDTYRHGNHTHTVPHTTTHFDQVWHNGPDYVPHTTTHLDRVRHNGHIDYVPHTTTHFDPVFPNAIGSNVIYPSQSAVYSSQSSIYASPGISYSSGAVYPSQAPVYATPSAIYPSSSMGVSPVLVQTPVPSTSSVTASAPAVTVDPAYSASRIAYQSSSNVIPSSNSVNAIPASVSSSATAPAESANVIPSSAGTNAIPATRRQAIIVNPRDSGGAVKYSLNSFAYTIRPGESQTVTLDRDWTIAFDNGLGKRVNYRLTEGKLQFTVSPETGWDIRAAAPTDAPAAPTTAPEAPTASENSIPSK